MRTSGGRTRIAMLAVLAMVITTGVIWKVGHVRAFNPQPDPPGKFGMVGLTRGQTIRVNVVNLVTLNDRQAPPDPCRVVLSFRNLEGQPVTNNDGQIVRRTVELQPGESAFLDFNGDQVGTGDTTGPGRMQLRPFVRVQLAPDPDPRVPPDPCYPTAEVFDNATLRTTLVMPGVESSYSANHNETLVRDSFRQRF